jgi:uncharacterized membrane protein YecN with MAPEG domain
MNPWQIYALIVVALFLKMFVVAGVQGIQRVKNKSFVRPEDAAFFGGGATPLSEELPIVQRAQHTLRNDLENIPIFLFLLLSYIQLGCWPLGVFIYGSLFVFSRILHTIAYLRPMQPLRNRAYLLGLLVMFCLCGHLVIRPFL